MKKVFLKSISVFLCIVCILGAVPLCASAAEVYAPVVSKDYEGLNYVDLTWNDTYPVDNYNVYLSSMVTIFRTIKVYFQITQVLWICQRAGILLM